MQLETSSAEWRSFCIGFNVLALMSDYDAVVIMIQW